MSDEIIIYMYIWLIFFIFLGISYIFYMIGLYKMAKNKGLNYSWLAFLVLVNFYILGEVINRKIYLVKKIDNAQVLLPCIFAILLFDYFNNSILYIFSLPFLLFAIIFLIATCYRLFKLYDAKNAVFYLALTLLTFGVASGVIVFILRNKEPIEYLP